MDRVEKLKEILTGNPADSFAAHALALEYVKRGRDAEAKQLWEELLEREPAYVGSYYQLGKVFERMGEKTKAIEWYERGMQEAKKAGDGKTLGELRTAADMLED